MPNEIRTYKEGATFLRLDNAAIVDFLTSTAGSLCEKGLISAKDTDNLRLVLSGIQSAAGSRESPVMLEMLQQNAEFLSLLKARYGTEGFCLNLLRHTIKPHLAETSQLLAEWGEKLLKKADLLFNRPFYIYGGGVCDRQTLYATVLIDLSEILGATCEKLARVQAMLATMNPHDMAGGDDVDLDTDQAIAKSLGFAGLSRQSLPAFTEVTAKKELSQALLMVAAAAANLAEQLTANSGHQAGYVVLIACDWLTAECQRLDYLEIPKTSSITSWEVRRRNLMACIASINEAIKEVAFCSQEAIGQDMRPNVAQPVTEATKRRIAFDLMTAGIQPAKAWEATEDLFRYLREKSIKPHELIVSELGRINANLLPRSLDVLVKLAGDKMMHGASEDKSSNMNRSRKLSEIFKSAALASVTLLLLLVPLLAGCGLKTDPKSDIPDFRPEVPYHGDEGKLNAPLPSPSGDIPAPNSQSKIPPLSAPAVPVAPSVVKP